MKRSSKHIDDREIKELFAAYERNEITINDILFNLSGYIYSFPRITQRLDEDSASDFFVYAIERLPKKLTQYKIKEVTFEAWFNVVLTRLYYDWIKKGKSPLKIEIAPDMEKYVAESSPFDPDKLLWKERYLGKIYDLLNTLPPKIQIIMKLHYFDFFSGDDIYLIYEIYDQEISFLVDNYDVLVNKSLRSLDKERKIMDKLNLVYQDIQRVEYQIYKCTDKDHVLSLKKHLSDLRQRHNRLLHDYQSIYRTLPARDIAFYLGISENSVYNLLYKGRFLIQMRLKELSV